MIFVQKNIDNKIRRRLSCPFFKTLFKTTVLFCPSSYQVMEKVKEASSYIVTDPSQPAKIFKSDLLNSHRVALTLPQLLSKAVELYPNHAALKFKESGNEKWSVITYNDYKSRAEKIAKCFIKLGLKEYESVAVLAFNCPEWLIAEVATIHAG